MSVTIELRGEGDAELRAIVREGLPLMLRDLARRETQLPGFVLREFRAYLGCGDAANGFAWLDCPDCRHHRLVLFSCKTRGFCPSCAGRRMAERAAHWIDRVIPHVATRQWVITVPWARRFLLARRADLADGVLRTALRCVERWYRGATGRTRGKPGAITVLQRFGSALNLNLHFHVVHLDGVYDRGADGALRFFQATPSTADIEALVVEIALACERCLAKQGFGCQDEDSADGDDDDAQAALQFASLSGSVATGERAGKQVRRVQRLGGKDFALPSRCAAYGGYNVHAGVSFAASDRNGLERLCRYVLRPPLAVGRLERLDNGRVRLGMKRTWSDGTTAIELSPVELVEKLAAIIPPPRANQTLYAGILAGNAAWRAEVVPKVPTSTEAQREERLALKLVKRGYKVSLNPRREDALCWAELLRRVFHVEGWNCPDCGKRMRLRTVVLGPPASTVVVRGLLHSRGPPDDVDESCVLEA